ncbi:MAG: sulfite exporter TauE/SafE family protein [Ginsengibacter sp.]
MENIYFLILIGFLIGTLGTLIGAGGGFILVPLLIILRPDFTSETITAISMVVVACNAISGSVAYMRTKKIDYKAGIIFALCTIPGSIFGVLTTKIIPRGLFDLIFGFVLIALALFLFFKGGKKETVDKPSKIHKGWIHRHLVDKWGQNYDFSYDLKLGMILSLFVGYFSPLLGIGGGIIHVPAMTEWLLFPVHIATATSHFILAIMSTVSVIVHYLQGNYNDPLIMKIVIGLVIGVVPGAQLGAYFSRRMNGKYIIKALAISIGIVGIKILFSRFL